MQKGLTMSKFSELIKALAPGLRSQKEINEDYLSHSVDIYDLERRMYEIQGRKNCDPTVYPIVQLRGL
jgi:hypothetical protein